VAAGGNVKGGKSSYADSAAGFWLGLDGGTPKFHIGNASKYMRWTGSALQIGGDVVGTDNIVTSGVTQAYIAEQFTNVVLGAGESTVVSHAVTPPSGTDWTGEVVFVGNIARPAYSTGQVGMSVMIYGYIPALGWQLARTTIHSFAPTPSVMHATVTLTVPWHLWSRDVTQWTVNAAGVAAVAMFVSGTLSCRVYKR